MIVVLFSVGMPCRAMCKDRSAVATGCSSLLELHWNEAGRTQFAVNVKISLK